MNPLDPLVNVVANQALNALETFSVHASTVKKREMAETLDKEFEWLSVDYVRPKE